MEACLSWAFSMIILIHQVFIKQENQHFICVHWPTFVVVETKAFLQVLLRWYARKDKIFFWPDLLWCVYRQNAFQVIAVDGVCSGIIQCLSAEDCIDWLQAIASNISNLTKHNVSMDPSKPEGFPIIFDYNCHKSLMGSHTELSAYKQCLRLSERSQLKFVVKSDSVRNHWIGKYSSLRSHNSLFAIRVIRFVAIPIRIRSKDQTHRRKPGLMQEYT